MRWLERVVVVLLFALGMGATLYPRTLVNWHQLGVSFDSVSLLVLVFLCLALGSMILRARMLPRVCNVLRHTPALTLLLLLALASTAWSIDPYSTLSRAVMLSGTCLVGLCLGLHYKAEQIVTLIIATVATLAVATIISVSLSATATHPDSGAWRGVFIHKNFLGRAMLIGFVALLMQLRSADLSRSARLGYLLILTLVGALIFLSRSATAWLLASVAAGLSVYLPYLLRPTARRDYAVVIGGGVLGVLVGAVAILDPAGIPHFLGKDDTLTGRTYLWDIVFPHLLQRPWLGYGYGAFWPRFFNPISHLFGWPAPHPHNGYIQLVLDLGVVGLLLFAFCFVLVFYRATIFSCSDSRQMNLFPMLVLFCLATVNVAETRLIKFDDFWWMLFGIVVALTSDAVKKNYPHAPAWKKVLETYKKPIMALGFVVVLGLFVMGWSHLEAKRPGLSGQYYSQPNLTELHRQRIDHVIDFRWHVSSPFPEWKEDNFSVRWTGFVRIPTDGEYAFYTQSDDGVRLWVGKEQIINNWTHHNTTDVNRAALHLKAGYYPLRLEYYEHTREATIRLFWKPEFMPQTRLISPKYLVPSRELLKPNVPVHETDGASDPVAELPAALSGTPRAVSREDGRVVRNDEDNDGQGESPWARY